MKGYFISSETAKNFGLLDNHKIKNELQKVFIAVTDRDALEYSENALKSRNLSEVIPEKIYDEIGNWFYKIYYDGLIDTIINTIENGKDKK